MSFSLRLRFRSFSFVEVEEAVDGIIDAGDAMLVPEGLHCSSGDEPSEEVASVGIFERITNLKAFCCFCGSIVDAVFRVRFYRKKDVRILYTK